jgi:histone H3
LWSLNDEIEEEDFFSQNASEEDEYEDDSEYEDFAKSKAEESASYRSNIDCITDTEIKLLMRKAGILAETKDTYKECRMIMKKYLESFLPQVIANAERERLFSKGSSQDKGVTVDNVLSLQPNGITTLGYGIRGIRYVWSPFIARVLAQVHPGSTLTPKAMSVMNDISTDILLRIVAEAEKLLAIERVRRAEASVKSVNGRFETEEFAEASYSYDFNAGPKDEESGLLTDAEKVRVYSTSKNMEDYQLNPKDFERLSEPVKCISAKEMQYALKMIFKGDLFRCAASEGDMALTRTRSYACKLNEILMGAYSRLQFIPAIVALVANRVSFGSAPMTLDAVIYAAAAIEELVASVLDLAGSTRLIKEGGSSSCVMDCKSISLALETDKNLREIMSSHVIRESGVNLTAKYLYDSYRQFERLVDEPTAFETILLSKIEFVASDDIGSNAGSSFISETARDENTVLIDPRSGLHCYVGLTSENVRILRPCPFLDECSLETRDRRRHMAEAMLSPEELSIMKSEGRSRNKRWYNTFITGIKPSFTTIYRRNMREIRRMQKSKSFVLNKFVFFRVVMEIGQDFATDFVWTAEALECIQDLTEAHLLSLFQVSAHLMLHAKRHVMTLEDLRLARLQFIGQRIPP